MKWLEQAFSDTEAMKQIRDVISRGEMPLQINGCVDVQVAHMMYLLGQDCPLKLIVTYSEERARKLYEDYHCFDRSVLYYPAKDALFYSADIHSGVTQSQRLAVMKQIVETGSATVVTTIDGGLDRLLTLEQMRAFCVSLKVEQELSLTEFSEQLVDLGYENVAMVQKPGEYAIRGGILDLFPTGEEAPYRVELWGDEIDTIRSFDVESQRSIEQVDAITIFPATEMPLTKKRLKMGQIALEAEYDVCYNQYLAERKENEAANLKYSISGVIEALSTYRLDAGIDSFLPYFYKETASLFDLFSGEGGRIFLEEPSWVKETLSASMKEFCDSMEDRILGGYMLPGQKEIFYREEEIGQRLQHGPIIYFSKIGYRDPAYAAAAEVEFHGQTTNTYRNHFELLLSDLRRWQKDAYRVMLLCGSDHRGKHLTEEFMEAGLSAYYKEELNDEVAPGQIAVTVGSISSGFVYVNEKIVILSEDDIIRRKTKKRRSRARFKGEVIKNFDDLSIGDYVVHVDRGVGIYRGIVQRELDDIIRDYISIEYAGGDMYYINVNQMDKVQRYASSDSKKPKLNKLGSKDWEKTKNRVQKQVGVLAKELVTLYAIRQQKQGFACEPDTVWQTEFEEQFPYEETNDQQKAIDETKADMESTKIMDRLICGDVGYGKTEVALRAAFKAVTNSKQVVYLVPTTVLAQQHFNTFTERMKAYPITIKMLSRFCTKKEQEETIKGLKSGEVDIVIGTHRVFSKDVTYRNLGLLIIDEEQRFGVTHKERIKQMKKDVDVLTLTATPIPRTLHMSLSGIRDMSLLNEAPVNRHAIQTYVMEYNEEMIKEAIKREIARGGQVYYVFNRVKNIEEMTETIRRLVPAARVEYGHGQMSEVQLERVMMRFIEGEIDVLVSTTIIETGIDIPNVNTIIIHDADNFGLSQLYQLRGRVGRSGRRAFAFLLYRRNKLIKETAQKRLEAIREFTDLGSGFKIAMRDLEIRGAGNVLGEDQSGHLEAVGYDLYCQMLNQALLELKGEGTPVVIDTTIDLELTAYLPAAYVKNEFQKLALYKRIASISTKEECYDMTDELIDRYGELPQEVSDLLEIALIKNRASGYYITKIVQKEGRIKMDLYERAPADIGKMDALLKKHKGKLRFLNEKVPAFVLATGHLKEREILPHVQQLMEEIGALMEVSKNEDIS